MRADLRKRLNGLEVGPNHDAWTALGRMTEADRAIAGLLYAFTLHEHQMDSRLTAALEPFEYSPRHAAAVDEFIHALQEFEPVTAAEYRQVFEANYPEHARAR